MALVSLPVSLSVVLVTICVFHKMVAILMVQNILGLPDYVIGELLSSSNLVARETSTLRTSSRIGPVDSGGGGNSGNNGNGNTHHISSNPCVLTSEQLDSGDFIPSHVNLNDENVRDDTGHLSGINCCDDRYKYLSYCTSINCGRSDDNCNVKNSDSIRISETAKVNNQDITSCINRNCIIGSADAATGTHSSSSSSTSFSSSCLSSSKITSSSSNSDDNDSDGDTLSIVNNARSKSNSHTKVNYLELTTVDDSILKSVSLGDILISNSFPGRVSSQSVRIISPLVNDVTLKFRSYYIEPHDEVRFKFELLSNETIISTGENIIGTIYFDPIKACKSSCYAGLPIRSDSLKLLQKINEDSVGLNDAHHDLKYSPSIVRMFSNENKDSLSRSTFSIFDSSFVPSQIVRVESSKLHATLSDLAASSSHSISSSSSPSTSPPGSSSSSSSSSSDSSDYDSSDRMSDVISSFWLRGFSLNAESSTIDANLLSSFRERWSQLYKINTDVLTGGNTLRDKSKQDTKSNKISDDSDTYDGMTTVTDASSSTPELSNIINATLNLQLESGQMLKFRTSTRLNWPRIVVSSSNEILFPLTRFGDHVTREVLIENPTSHPLLIQGILAPSFFTSDYLNAILRASGTWSNIPQGDLKYLDRKSFRIIVNTEDNDIITSKFNMPITPGTQGILLPAGQRARIIIEFGPKWEQKFISQNNDGKSSSSSSTSNSGQSNKSEISSFKFTSFLLIRNNLTIIDAIKLQGEAGFGLLKIGKELPGLTSMLTFDLQEKHLSKSCNVKNIKSTSGSKLNSKQGTNKNGKNSDSITLSSSTTVNSASTTTGSSNEPQFTVHKHFNLINYGKIPVNVRGFLIGPHVGVSSSSYKSKSTLASLNDQPIGSNKLLEQLIGKVRCQGFGFKVLNCESLSWNISEKIDDPNSVLVIQPNESKKIHIAFTPDFTVAKTMATLTVITDDGPFPDEIEKSWHQVLENELILPLSWFFKLTTWNPFACYSRSTGYNDKSDRGNMYHPYASRYSLSSGTKASSSNISSKYAIDGLSELGIGLITYSLVATVPKSLLSNCDESLPRPYQEMILYYTLVVFMLCLITVTVAFAFIDGTRVLNFTFYPAVLMTRTSNNCLLLGSSNEMYPETFKPFSLRLNENGIIEADTESIITNHDYKGRKNIPLNYNKNKKQYNTSLTASTSFSSSCSSSTSSSSLMMNVDGKKNTSKITTGKTITKRLRDSAWNIICQNNLVSGGDRRGSNGSSNSSEVLIDNCNDSTGTSKVKTSKCNSTGDSNKQITSTNVTSNVKTNNYNESYSRRKLNARSWFESLTSRSEATIDKKEEPALALPSFEDEFDAEDIQNLKGRKGNKKDKSTHVKSKQQSKNTNDIASTGKSSNMLPNDLNTDSNGVNFINSKSCIKNNLCPSPCSSSTTSSSLADRTPQVVMNDHPIDESCSNNVVNHLMSSSLYDQLSHSPSPNTRESNGNVDILCNSMLSFINNSSNDTVNGRNFDSTRGITGGSSFNGGNFDSSLANARTTTCCDTFQSSTESSNDFHDQFTLTTGKKTSPSISTDQWCEFGGYWSPSNATDNKNVNSSSIGASDETFWESITMFDSESAMRELLENNVSTKKGKSNANVSVTNGKHHTNGNTKNGHNGNLNLQKSTLCSFAASSGSSIVTTPVTATVSSCVSSNSLSNTNIRSSTSSTTHGTSFNANESFPPVGTFQISDVFQTSSITGTSSANHSRQIHTPSPRGWSPSHKSLQQQQVHQPQQATSLSHGPTNKQVKSKTRSHHQHHQQQQPQPQQQQQVSSNTGNLFTSTSIWPTGSSSRIIPPTITSTGLYRDSCNTWDTVSNDITNGNRVFSNDLSHVQSNDHSCSNVFQTRDETCSTLPSENNSSPSDNVPSSTSNSNIWSYDSFADDILCDSNATQTGTIHWYQQSNGKHSNDNKNDQTTSNQLSSNEIKCTNQSGNKNTTSTGNTSCLPSTSSTLWSNRSSDIVTTIGHPRSSSISSWPVIENSTVGSRSSSLSSWPNVISRSPSDPADGATSSLAITNSNSIVDRTTSVSDTSLALDPAPSCSSSSSSPSSSSQSSGLTSIKKVPTNDAGGFSLFGGRRPWNPIGDSLNPPDGSI